MASSKDYLQFVLEQLSEILVVFAGSTAFYPVRTDLPKNQDKRILLLFTDDMVQCELQRGLYCAPLI